MFITNAFQKLLCLGEWTPCTLQLLCNKLGLLKHKTTNDMSHENLGRIMGASFPLNLLLNGVRGEIWRQNVAEMKLIQLLIKME